MIVTRRERKTKRKKEEGSKIRRRLGVVEKRKSKLKNIRKHRRRHFNKKEESK